MNRRMIVSLSLTLAVSWLSSDISSVFAASSGGVHLDKVRVDIHDQDSLQKGLALYTNYCMGCHGLSYARYERTALDLGIPADLVEKYLISDTSKIGSLMTTAMPEDLSSKWFGVAPPDLTLIARARGADWVYTYLRSFYADPARPWGVNNTVFKDVGMPHALLELQGLAACAPGPVLAANGGIKRHPLTGQDLLEDPCGRFEIVSPGTMSPQEYDRAVADLTNFLVYIAEPAALVRYRMGVYVMFFLAVLLVFSWLLKREYWKGIH